MGKEGRGGGDPCTLVFLFLRVTRYVLSDRVSREVVRQEEGGGGAGEVDRQEGEGSELRREERELEAVLRRPRMSAGWLRRSVTNGPRTRCGG